MKKNIKIICLLTLMLTLSIKGFTQDSIKDAKIRTAFETSYIYEKALQYLKAINKLTTVYDENSYEINLRLAYLHYENASYIESARYYKKAIDINPKSIEAKLGYVLPLAALTIWDTVKIQYEAILNIEPNNSIVNYRLGLIYYYRADYNNALRYFDIANTLYPFDYEISLMNAWTNLKLENYEKAKILFNKVLMVEPNDASALEGLKSIK